MKISIEKADNGFIIYYPAYISDQEKEIEVIKSHVIQEPEGEFGEQEAFVWLCWELLDQFGITNSKHSRRRINIELTGSD